MFHFQQFQYHIAVYETAHTLPKRQETFCKKICAFLKNLIILIKISIYLFKLTNLRTVSDFWRKDKFLSVYTVYTWKIVRKFFSKFFFFPKIILFFSNCPIIGRFERKNVHLYSFWRRKKLRKIFMIFSHYFSLYIDYCLQGFNV